MSPRAMRSALAPWSGLFLGAAAWFIAQQAGANANFWDCGFGGLAFGVGVSLICAAVTVAGGVVSWRARRAGGEDRPGTRRFAGLVGAATAGIFLMAISFQTLGSAIVPACAQR